MAGGYIPGDSASLLIAVPVDIFLNADFAVVVLLMATLLVSPFEVSVFPVAIFLLLVLLNGYSLMDDSYFSMATLPVAAFVEVSLPAGAGGPGAHRGRP